MDQEPRVATANGRSRGNDTHDVVDVDEGDDRSLVVRRPVRGGSTPANRSTKTDLPDPMPGSTFGSMGP